METIGFFKYTKLCSLKKSQLTPEEVQMIKDYEENRKGHTIDKEYVNEYVQKIRSIPEEFDVRLTPEQIYNSFLKSWEGLHQKELIRDKDMNNNLYVLNHYFAGSLSFKKLLEPLSEPSIDKGLLIIGSFGNGKTDVMRAMQNALQIKGYSFKMCSAPQVVEMYESCKEPHEKKEFWNLMTKGRAHFDDVLSEDISSNYGKKEVFKDIILKRYEAGVKTHMTINFREKRNTQDAIDQLAERYGERFYDRIFEMFNIYHWKGKSFRR